jgi:excisionase family DNA binding protein
MDHHQDVFLSKPRTVQEIAQWIGSSERFIWREIERGNLRAVRLGVTFVRCLPDDITAWLEHGATRPKKTEELEPA